MPIRLDLVEVGTRVAYEDRANPRREGRVVEIVKLGGETPGGLPLPSGVEYRVRWDDIPDQFDDPIVERASALIRSGTPQGKAWRQAIAEARETTSDLRQHGWTMLAGNLLGWGRRRRLRLHAVGRDPRRRPRPDPRPDPRRARLRPRGWLVPVALTTAVANIVIPTEREARDYHQDAKGRLWDLLHMAATHGARRDASEVVFPCIFWLAGPDRVAAGLVRRAQQKNASLQGDYRPGRRRRSGRDDHAPRRELDDQEEGSSRARPLRDEPHGRGASRGRERRWWVSLKSQATWLFLYGPRRTGVASAASSSAINSESVQA